MSEETHIPARQIHRGAQQLSDLTAKLVDNELGLCLSEGEHPVLYTKVDGELVPVNGKEMTDTEVEDILRLLG